MLDSKFSKTFGKIYLKIRWRLEKHSRSCIQLELWMIPSIVYSSNNQQFSIKWDQLEWQQIWKKSLKLSNNFSLQLINYVLKLLYHWYLCSISRKNKYVIDIFSQNLNINNKILKIKNFQELPTLGKWKLIKINRIILCNLKQKLWKKSFSLFHKI